MLWITQKTVDCFWRVWITLHFVSICVLYNLLITTYSQIFNVLAQYVHQEKRSKQHTERKQYASNL